MNSSAKNYALKPFLWSSRGNLFGTVKTFHLLCCRWRCYGVTMIQLWRHNLCLQMYWLIAHFAFFMQYNTRGMANVNMRKYNTSEVTETSMNMMRDTCKWNHKYKQNKNSLNIKYKYKVQKLNSTTHITSNFLNVKHTICRWMHVLSEMTNLYIRIAL